MHHRLHRHALRLLAGLLSLAAAGCVARRLDEPERSWPAPVEATSLRAFEGVYLDRALEVDRSGAPPPNEMPLFAFLLGPEHFHRGDGLRVEIRATPDGQSLALRLLDRNGREVDAGRLGRGEDVRLSGGTLTLRLSSGTRPNSLRWGPGLVHLHAELRLTTDGSLRGKDRSRRTGLALAFIPVAESNRYYWLWPRVAP